jgi:hypothetical protein
MFKDISNFENMSDYLPILNGILIAELIAFILLFLGLIKSEYLRLWYNKFSISAIISDVSIIFIGIIITRYLYTRLFSSFNIIKFLLLAGLVQMIHDILFYYLFKNIEYGKNSMLDIFKKYADELGAKILFGDTLLVMAPILIGSLLAYKDTNTNIILFVVLIYLLPYFYTNT